MAAPLTRKWNLALYKEIQFALGFQLRKKLDRMTEIPDGQKIPSLKDMQIGSAKRMTAAILFFDLENFTSISAQLSNEYTLYLLNVITSAMMIIVRKWNGVVEKHTGDGIMAIIGAEAADMSETARDGIECALSMKYVMLNDIQPQLIERKFPRINFRIGVDVGELLISRIGIHSMNFLTAVGDAANRASKLQEFSVTNGITIGEDVATSLPRALHDYMQYGDDPRWQVKRPGLDVRYNYFHYNFNWPEPSSWPKEWIKYWRLQR